MNFQDQYKDPRWQKKRLDVLSLNGFLCRDCESADKTLHVHHPRYIKGRKIWEYETSELMCLCEDCHNSHHIIDSELSELLSDYTMCFGLDVKLWILGYLDGSFMPFVRYPENKSYMDGFVQGNGDDMNGVRVMNPEKAGLTNGKN